MKDRLTGIATPDFSVHVNTYPFEFVGDAATALKEGIHTPAFGVALTLAFIVMLDANGLRKKMGQHAISINKINKYETPILRERIGHSQLEIMFGALLGLLVASVINIIFTA